MRNQFSRTLYTIIKKNPKVVLLSGDIGNKLFDKIKKINNGKNFINCGVAEQNMVSMAAGMGLNGLKPIVYTITPFLIYRAFEQIKIDICYNSSPVILVGTGSGFSYSHLGTTHHSLEDITLIKSLPDINIYTPCDTREVEFCLKEAMKSKKPSYIRLGKKGEPLIHKKNIKFIAGKSTILQKGKDLIFFVYGPIIKEAIKAAYFLKDRFNLSSTIISCKSLEPFDFSKLNKINRYKLVLTLEEHVNVGGLSEIINNFLLNKKNIGKVINFNIKKNFFHKIGSQEYLRKSAKIDSYNIVKKIKENINVK